jgi:hypothetical protein
MIRIAHGWRSAAQFAVAELVKLFGFALGSRVLQDPMIIIYKTSGIPMFRNNYLDWV